MSGYAGGVDSDLVTHWIMLALGFVSVVAGIFAFVHAIAQRAEAFNAVNRLTKGKWVGITAAGTAACALFLLGASLFILWMAGLVAVLVYLVDVRPAVNEVQRGSGR
jgi:uncharacterized membrane protein HdeD (DUF308 family)